MVLVDWSISSPVLLRNLRNFAKLLQCTYMSSKIINGGMQKYVLLKWKSFEIENIFKWKGFWHKQKVIFCETVYAQKQPSRGVHRKRCSENIQQIYRGTPMPKCDFNKVAKQFYWNHTLAWVFSCKFAAYFKKSFS